MTWLVQINVQYAIVIKMDCLIDVIYELRNLQERLHKKMYRPNRLKNGIKEE